MELLLDNYYGNYELFQLIYRSIFEEISILNDLLEMVNCFHLSNEYISIGPHADYLEEYSEIKMNISNLIPNIRNNTQALSYIILDMNENFSEILTIDFNFEGEEYTICYNLYSEFMSEEYSLMRNRIFIT